MSKCYVQVKLIGDTLHMKERMQDGLPDVNDPDLGSPQIIADTADDCDVDNPAGSGWSDWMTYVFVRPANDKE